MTASPSMRLPSVKLLVKGQRIEEGVLCGICREFLSNPRHCSGCDADMCAECNPEGKHCGRPTEGPHKVLQKLLQTYRFHCPNRNQGCTDELGYDSITGHALVCGFASVDCILGCAEKVTRSDAQKHLKVCALREEKCTFCFTTFQFCQLEQHHLSCPAFPVTCPGCQALVCRAASNEHFGVCPYLPEPCELCQAVVPRNLKQQHTERDCLYLSYLQISQQIARALERVGECVGGLSRVVAAQVQQVCVVCGYCQQYEATELSEKCVDCARFCCRACAKEKLGLCGLCRGVRCSHCHDGQSPDVCLACAQRKKSHKKAVRKPDP